MNPWPTDPTLPNVLRFDVRGAERRPIRRRPVSPALWGAIVTLAWAATWLLFFDLVLPPRAHPPPAAAPLHFLPLPPSPEKVEADPRLIWSPALLALPSPWGFSSVILSERVGVRPSMTVSEPRSFLFIERPTAQSQSFPSPIARLEDEVARNLFRMVIPTETPAFDSRKTTPRFQVEWPPTWGPSDFIETPWPADIEKLSTAPWEIGALLQAGEGDRIEHVFLESPCPLPAVNRAIERALRTWKLAPEAPARDLRVVLRFSGPPAAGKKKAPSS